MNLINAFTKTMSGANEGRGKGKNQYLPPLVNRPMDDLTNQLCDSEESEPEKDFIDSPGEPIAVDKVEHWLGVEGHD